MSLKWLGMHGSVYANNAANEADLLLAIGVRFDDRVTGKVEKFCEHGTIVHIDIDNSELNKNKLVKLPILSDLKYALSRANPLLARRGASSASSTHPLPLRGTSRSTPGRKIIRFPSRTRMTSSSLRPSSSSSTR